MSDFQDSYKNTKKCKNCGITVTRNARTFSYCIKCARKIKLAKHRIADKNYADKNRPWIREKNRKWNRTDSAKEFYKKYRAKPEYKIYTRLRRANMPINKRKAGYYFRNAIRSGLLIKPENCSRCDIKEWGVKRSMIEGHHFKGYEPENWLEIQWLCTNCHKKAHNFIK